MATQVQVGNVQMGGETPNPLGGVLSGVATGADWAMKAYEMDNNREKIAAQAEHTKMLAMKNRFDMGEKAMSRIKRIAVLPNGPTKKSEISLLDEDMQAFGTPLSASARAVMMDPNYQQDLIQISNYMDSQDPVKRVQAYAQLPYILQSKEFTDVFLKIREEAGKGARSTEQAMATAADKAAGRDFEAQKVRFQAAKEKDLLAQKGAQEKEINAAKIEEDKRKQDEDLKFKREELYAKLAADKDKVKGDVVKEVKISAGKIFDDFKPAFDAAKVVKTFATTPNAVGDQAIMGAAQILTEGKASVLREGDVARLGSVGGAIDRFKGYAQKLQGGGTLGPEARKDFLKTAIEIEKAYTASYLDRISPDVERTKAKGISPGEAFTGDQLRLLGSIGVFKDTKTSIQKASDKIKSDKAKEDSKVPTIPAEGKKPPEQPKVIMLDGNKLLIVRQLLSRGKSYEEIKARIGGDLHPNQKKALGIKE